MVGLKVGVELLMIRRVVEFYVVLYHGDDEKLFFYKNSP